MKKLILLAVFLLPTTALLAQETTRFVQETEMSDTKASKELKINLFNLIALKWVDASYEKIINEESTYGVGLLFSLDDETMSVDEYRTFSLTPFYRQFFSNQHAQGFFVEVFGMLHSGEDEFFEYDYDADVEYYREESYTDFAVGISAGAKFITPRGFVGEVYLGLGRDLLGNSDMEIVGRGGISLGYRF